MYKPYFYIIQHIDSGKYYAGSKWGRSSHHKKERFADPKFFMIEGGYLTSSTIVKSIIEKEGISSFKVRTIKSFDTAKQVRNYEARFLKKVKAKTNDKFFNLHENSLIAWGTDEYKDASLKKYGVEHPMQCDSVKEKIKISVKNKHGVEYGFLLDTSRKTMLNRYGVEYAMQSAEIQETRRKNTLEKHGVDHHMKNSFISKKVVQSKIEKYGSKSSPNEIKATVDRNKTRSKRPKVLAIIEMRNKFKFKLEKSWWMKNDEYIDNLFLELKIKYANGNP